jgi:hypothetical protein
LLYLQNSDLGHSFRPTFSTFQLIIDSVPSSSNSETYFKRISHDTSKFFGC